MPILRYFVGVGSALLVLLLLANVYLPQTIPPDLRGSIDKSTIRITSQRKGPERVVIDTSLPTIVPPAATSVAVAEPQPSAAVREAFAQMTPLAAKSLAAKSASVAADDAKKLEAKRAKQARAASRQRWAVAAVQKPVPQQQQRQVADVFAPFWTR